MNSGVIPADEFRAVVNNTHRVATMPVNGPARREELKQSPRNDSTLLQSDAFHRGSSQPGSSLDRRSAAQAPQ
jgi:hypothetical protein